MKKGNKIVKTEKNDHQKLIYLLSEYTPLERQNFLREVDELIIKFLKIDQSDLQELKMSAPSNVSISNIINFTGVLGLLISLWFVNEEIKQSRLLAEAEFNQNRNHSLMAFYSAPLEGSNLAAQMMKSGAEIEIDWSDAEESAIYTAIARVRILSLLNAYNIYK